MSKKEPGVICCIRMEDADPKLLTENSKPALCHKCKNAVYISEASRKVKQQQPHLKITCFQCTVPMMLEDSADVQIHPLVMEELRKHIFKNDKVQNN